MPAHLRLALLLAALTGPALAHAGDIDGDGVPEPQDLCPNTPAGTAVDSAGRPFGDIDADCDTDMDDMALFQSGFTGPLTPLEPEICDDGLDNDADGLTDCADAADCPAGTPCGGQSHCAQDHTCGCPAAFADCDGNLLNGCERALNANPPCNPPIYLGAVDGDQGAAHLQVFASGERWYRLRINENNDGDVYLSAAVTLLSPPGVDYDLYLRCAACAGQITASSSNHAGPLDTLMARWDDDWFGEDDSYDVILEVRYHAGVGCGDFQLDIFGNANADGFPNTCNP